MFHTLLVKRIHSYFVFSLVRSQEKSVFTLVVNASLFPFWIVRPASAFPFHGFFCWTAFCCGAFCGFGGEEEKGTFVTPCSDCSLSCKKNERLATISSE